MALGMPRAAATFVTTRVGGVQGGNPISSSALITNGACQLPGNGDPGVSEATGRPEMSRTADSVAQLGGLKVQRKEANRRRPPTTFRIAAGELLSRDTERTGHVVAREDAASFRVTGTVEHPFDAASEAAVTKTVGR